MSYTVHDAFGLFFQQDSFFGFKSYEVTRDVLITLSEVGKFGTESCAKFIFSN